MGLYGGKPNMYKAELGGDGQLIITPVSPEIYMRFGTEGLGVTREEAIIYLKQTIMDRFERDMRSIWWQSKAYTE